MPLPPQSIEEIRSMASRRNTSPRGVADVNLFNSDGESDGSSRRKTSPEFINACATTFLKDVMDRTMTMMSHCGRMTIVPADVARALDFFAEMENNTGAKITEDEAMMEDDNDDVAMETDTKNTEVKIQDIEVLRDGMLKLQARVRGAIARDQIKDHTLVYHSDSESEFDDEEPYIESTLYDESNSSAPKFNEVYPPVAGIDHLTDEQFKEQVLLPLFMKEYRFRVRLGDGAPCAKGHIACDCEDRSEDQDMVIVGMLKRATYSFLVKKLS